MKNNDYVLIYGFGWSGKNVLYLCEIMGLNCKVIDDGIDLSLRSDTRFVDDSFIASNPPKICLICINNKPELVEKIKQKLHNLKIGEEIIKNIKFDYFSRVLARLIKDNFVDGIDFIENLLRDDFELSYFSSIYKSILEKYRNNKDEISSKELSRYNRISKYCANKNIHGKIFETSMDDVDKSILYYPGFYTFIDRNSKDKNFFFMENIDFESLRYRDSNVKLIAIFGPSTVRGAELKQEERLTFHLEETMRASVGGDYIILNLGVGGFGLYEQFLLYSSLLYSLRPEVVVSFFFGVEICSQFFDNDSLLKNHDIFYNNFFNACQKKLFDSDVPLESSLYRNKCIDVYDRQMLLLDSINIRLKQFKDMVTCNGGVFIPCITPLLHCKKHWTKDEEKGYKEIFLEYPKFYGYMREKDAQLIEIFKNNASVKVYDINTYICDYKESIFCDWIHPTSNGNKIIANYLYKIMQAKQLFND